MSKSKGMRLNQRQLKSLDKRINRAFKKTAEQYSEAIDAELRDSKWDWPRTTKRRSGPVVGSPRDAVDTGDMADSRQPVRMEGDTAIIEFTSDHASVVFTGQVDQSIYPARPAHETALTEGNIEEVWEEQLRGNLQ